MKRYESERTRIFVEKASNNVDGITSRFACHKLGSFPKRKSACSNINGGVTRIVFFLCDMSRNQRLRSRVGARLEKRACENKISCV